jgi:murein L,D-transpeptidase YafK
MPKLLVILLLGILMPTSKRELPDSKLATDVRENVWPKLEKELSDKGLKPDSPIYLRIFKDEHLMEIWVKARNQYRLFKTYEVCFFSGGLGTKTRRGDGKSPEGFYTIAPKQLNPVSNYYLAINVGYPNKLEMLKGYTGDAIMVHGHCASIGCYAMTNPQIEEIYTLAYKAFENGQQKIDLDIFPFRMDPGHFKKYAHLPYQSFWKTMKPGYDLFERNHLPPPAGIEGREYTFASH